MDAALGEPQLLLQGRLPSLKGPVDLVGAGGGGALGVGAAAKTGSVGTPMVRSSFGVEKLRAW